MLNDDPDMVLGGDEDDMRKCFRPRGGVTRSIIPSSLLILSSPVSCLVAGWWEKWLFIVVRRLIYPPDEMRKVRIQLAREMK